MNVIVLTWKAKTEWDEEGTKHTANVRGSNQNKMLSQKHFVHLLAAAQRSDVITDVYSFL